MKRLSSLLIILFCVTTTSLAQEIPVITLDTISRLELGYAGFGECRGFSPDGKLLITTANAVYDTSTGEKRFEVQSIQHHVNTGGSYHHPFYAFSPDNSLLAMGEDAVYDTRTGEPLFSLTDSTVPQFSQDMRFLVVESALENQTIVYDVPTASITQIFSDTEFALSPDSRLIAISEQGVYNIETGDLLFTLPDYEDYNNMPMAFSPDNRYLAVANDAVYELNGGEQLFEIAGLFWSEPVFSSDSHLLAVKEDAIYELENAEIRFSVNYGSELVFAPNNRYLAEGASGIFYDIEAGGYAYNFPTAIGTGKAEFNTDGTLLASDSGHIIDVSTGTPLLELTGWTPIFNSDSSFLAISMRFENDRFCTVYGIEGYPWSYRVGHIVANKQVNIRQHPSTDSPILRGQSGDFFVYARTADNSWYKVAYYIDGIRDYGYGWVAASVVEVIDMPDAVRIEN